MADTLQKSATATLLEAVYKNVKTATDTLLALMPKAEDEDLKNDMTVQLSVYEGFASRCAKLLAREGGVPEDEGFLSKLTSRMGMAMSTLRDAGREHLARMLAEDAVTGVNELTDALRVAEEQGVSEDALHLAASLCEYEQSVARDMKVY